MRVIALSRLSALAETLQDILFEIEAAKESAVCEPQESCDAQASGEANAADRLLVQRAKRHFAERRAKDRVFRHPTMFGEPAWDVLLELYIAWVDGEEISISSAALASACPLSTGLRYIAHLERAGWVKKRSSPNDGRRAYAELTPLGIDLIRKVLRHR